MLKATQGSRKIYVGLALMLLCFLSLDMPVSSWAAEWHFMTMVGSTYPGLVYSPPIATPIATKAVCGKDDRRETGLQGQTSLADRYAPGRPRAFNCNLEYVSQSTGDGSDLGSTVGDKCAFLSQWQEPLLPPVLKNPGLVVIDVKDSSHPKIIKYLQTPGGLDSNESAEVRSSSNMHLLLMQGSDQMQKYGKTVDIYDVSDCDKPVLKFSGILPAEGNFKRFNIHTGVFNHEATIFWGGSGPDVDDTVSALDVSDPVHPKIIAQWHPTDPHISRFHSVTLSDDGNTLYVAIGRHFPLEQTEKPTEGMLILDVSEVQARKPNAQIKMIGQPLVWEDVYHNQYVGHMTIKGRKYIWESDIDGAIPLMQNMTGRQFKGTPLETRDDSMLSKISPEESCRRSGKPAWGYASLIDVENPLKPERVGALRLEVHEPKNCLALTHDPMWAINGYAPLGCDVDNPKDTKKMVCGFGEGGVRVFDVRDVKHVKELAYYKPPAVGTAPRAASMFQTFRDTGITTGPTKDHTTDAITTTFFENGSREIWFFSFDNGFQVVRFSDEFIAKNKDLFP